MKVIKIIFNIIIQWFNKADDYPQSSKYKIHQGKVPSPKNIKQGNAHRHGEAAP